MVTIDIFRDAGWEEQKHPRGKGEHGGQFVKKGEADVTTHEHARYAGTNPHEHTTEGLHKALTLLKPANLNKIDREHRKKITAEIINRTFQKKPAAVTPPAAPAKQKVQKAPKFTGDPKTDNNATSSKEIADTMIGRLKSIDVLKSFVKFPLRDGNGYGVQASNLVGSDGMPDITLWESVSVLADVDADNKSLTFHALSNPHAGTGYGAKMVDVLVNSVPKHYKIIVEDDVSGGFWEHIAKRYPDRQFEWVAAP